MSGHHLRTILSAVSEELAKRKSMVPFSEIAGRARANPAGRREIRRFLEGVPGIIAEIKRGSPSRGWIRRDLDAADTARAYKAGGACAVSVLTETRHFGGTLRDLAEASRASGGLPVLRKDFLLDEYMVAESRAYGADLVLLIVAVLGERTGEMVRMAAEYGLEALVEVHDAKEMETAARSGATMIGINNRNLATLAVDLDTAAKLLPLAPDGAVRVVESGISSGADAARYRGLGVDAYLVGESIVRAADPKEAIRILKRDLQNTVREKERSEWKRRSS